MKTDLSHYTPMQFVLKLDFRTPMKPKILEQDFLKSTRLNPTLTLKARDFQATMFVADPRRIVADADRKIYMLITGEVRGLPGEWRQSILESYRSSGMEFVKKLDGNFHIVIIDLLNAQVQIVTDRLNSKRIFYHRDDNGYWLSNSLTLHPTRDLAIDNTAVASYLINCALFENRTLFKGLSCFPACTINQISKAGIETIQYREYKYTAEYKNETKTDLIAEYKRLITAGVARCIENKEQIFLSLSGGHDARGILGSLNELGVIDRVQAISYYQLAAPNTNNDAQVARQLCDLIGCAHHTFKSYSGDIEKFIEHNAERGQGYAHFCTDADAWETLAKEFSITPGSVLLVGDVNLPQRNLFVKNKDGIMNWLFIFDAAILKPYLDWLNEPYRNELMHLWQEAYRRILDNLPVYTDIIDLRDYMYAALRLENIILPWRNCFQEPFIRTFTPFLSSEIIDFTLKLPVKYRFNKSLFKETLKQMFPALFSIPTANAPLTRIDWDNEAIQKKDEIAAHLSSTTSRFDEYIDPGRIIAYMRGVQAKRSREIPYYRAAARSMLDRLVKIFPGYKQVLLRIPGLRALNNRVHIASRMNYFLEKLLILRCFLSNK